MKIDLTNRTAVDNAVKIIRQAAGKAELRGVAVDLGSAVGCAALFHAEPNPDILVNKVGIFEMKDFSARRR